VKKEVQEEYKRLHRDRHEASFRSAAGGAAGSPAVSRGSRQARCNSPLSIAVISLDKHRRFD
jgi:hypothetical protein